MGTAGEPLKVPEKPREKPVFVEHAGEIFWFNRNAKGELWLNAKASKYADKDVVNPGSVILSGVMMFEYMGWQEAADLIISGLDKAIGSKTVTYDFARLMEGAKQVKCSEFASEMIKHMG